MKINMQKVKRLAASFFSFLSVACLLMAAVPAAGAVSVPYRYFTFNNELEVPTSVARSELVAGVPVVANTYEESKTVSLLKVVIHSEGLAGARWSLYMDDLLIYSGNPTNDTAFIWHEILYKTLVFSSQTDIDSSVLAWLEDNGTFTGEPPLIQVPEFDLDEIFPDDIIQGEYAQFANIVGIFIRNTITAPFVLTLFGLVLVSFILFGKK